MIQFTEISKEEIYNTHNEYYNDNARYFKISKPNKPLCVYGIFEHSKDIVEAFWVHTSFNRDVISKTFFNTLFSHVFSLGYKVVFTWSRCPKLINIFGKYADFGIVKVSCPAWDKDETKTWFMKRI
jgi:hypothetical protein